MAVLRRVSVPPGVARAGLRLLAEGGWLSVIYAALAVVAERRIPALGPLEMAALVGLGALVAGRTRDVPGLGAVLLAALAIAGGVAGWLVTDMAFTGLLAGVAVLRGARIEPDRDAAASFEVLLLAAVPAVGVVWAVTLGAAEPELIDQFSATALWGTILLISAGSMGMGLTRLNRLQGSTADRPTRRAWQLLVVAVGVAIVPLALPFGLASGIPIASLVAPLGRPIEIVFGWLVDLFTFMASLLLALLGLIFKPGTQPVEAPPPGPPPPPIGAGDVAHQDPLMGTIIAIVLLILFGAAIIAGALFYARWLIARPGRPGEARPEVTRDVERAIVHPATLRPAGRQHAPRRSRLGRPHDAVSAYLAALAELSPFADLARATTETPAAHSTRLRTAAAPVAPAMSRLAADYQLVRYAQRPLSAAEDRRALSRLERIRRLLRR